MTRDASGPSQPGGRIRIRKTRGALKPSQRVRSHGTHGDTGALLIKEVGFRAVGHVTAQESTSTEGQGPVLQEMW
jgi:hypothetical protein